MTPLAFWDKLMPIVGPLPDQERAAAVELALDAVRDQVRDPGRDQDEIDEATATRVLAELRARFERPLA
jgi:hypothetical protein